jgi:hypothetical protein
MRKRNLFASVLAMMVLGASQLMAWIQVVSLADLNDEMIQEFAEGKRGDVVVQCKEGMRLPFQMRMDGEFLSLSGADEAPLYLTVMKTCYVRCSARETFLFSSDLLTWGKFSEFFTGELKISVDAKSGGPSASLYLRLNERNR